MNTNKKYLYTNGSSVSVGGGFEPYSARKDIRDAYKERGIVLPKTQEECSYPYMIAKNLNLELINEAKSGSGIDRLVRKSMQYILNNLDKIHETLFLFEMQSGLRLDWYVADWNKYGVLNASYNPYEYIKNKTNYPFTLVQEWHIDDPDEQQRWNEKYGETIKNYFNSFFDHDIQFEREADKIIMFISFLNQLKIDYLIAIPNELDSKYQSVISKILPTKNNLNILFGSNFWGFSDTNELQIRHEVSHSDNHLGYFGNKKISKIITNYIKNIDSYRIPTYKIYTPLEFELLKTFFNSTDIILKKVTNPTKSNVIFISGLDTNFFNENDVIVIKRLQEHLKDVDVSNKKFMIVYFHEKMNESIFQQKIKLITDTFKIHENQIILLDSSINKKTNIDVEIPLELKIKQYSEYYNTSYELEIDKFKDKKFTLLIGQSNSSRIYVFDRVVHFYDDVDKLRNENIISLNNPFYLKDVNHDIKLYFDREKLKSLNLPWILDKGESIYVLNKSKAPIHKRFQDSVFSIVVETQSEFEPYDFFEDFLIDGSVRLNNFQISEKSILPLLNGNLPFIIHDGLIYEKLESLGFDFSYLKKIFNIDYKTNSFKQNADSIKLFVDYLKPKSIDELNKIRLENIHYIKNNFKVIKDIFDGYLSDREMEYLNWLFDETK